MIDLKEMKIITEKNQCKGLYFRGRVSTYCDGNGKIVVKKTLTLLKRKSCPGCEKCEWMFEYFQEMLNEKSDLIDDLEDFAIYTPEFSFSRDWETGYADIDDVKFIKIKED